MTIQLAHRHPHVVDDTDMVRCIQIMLSYLDDLPREEALPGYRLLAAVILQWASPDPACPSKTNESYAALDALGLDTPTQRIGRNKNEWNASLHALRQATRIVAFSDLPVGTRLRGMAPIGIEWDGTKTTAAHVKSDGNCPPSEFLITHAMRDGMWVPCRQ
jgi:hypothetical protein